MGPTRTPVRKMGPNLGDTGRGPHEEPQGRGVMGPVHPRANLSLRSARGALGPRSEKALSELPNGIGRHEARWNLISRAGGGRPCDDASRAQGGLGASGGPLMWTPAAGWVWGPR
jgi:hypothetical protein